MNPLLRRLLRRVVLALIVVASGWLAARLGHSPSAPVQQRGVQALPREPLPSPRQATALPKQGPTQSGDDAILAAFKARTSDVVVASRGVVMKVLPDDKDGARHQKLIVSLSSGHSLLIAHNIDLAPRVPVREGDSIDFKGKYEWSEQGGVLHWTHHDPDRRHADGWIKLAGKTYQ